MNPRPPPRAPETPPAMIFDDVWLILNDNHTPNQILKENIVNVFNFHPIHIYLNCPSIEFYNDNRPYFKNERALKTRRNKSFGVRNILISLLDKISKNGK